MKGCWMKICMIFVLLLGGISLKAQNIICKVDTLRFKSVGPIVDTFYLTREKLKGNVYRQVKYYGFSDNSNLTTVIDTFIISKNEWKKLYKSDTIPFLSVKDFLAKNKTYEYIDTVNKEFLYYEYEPVKRIRVSKKNFYLYKVKPMSGKGMVEGLGDDIRYMIFDFSIGEVYRNTYRIEKVLSGYESFVKDFKW